MDWLVTLGAVILGGVLAMLGGVVHESWQFNRRRRAAARVVLAGLIDSLWEVRLYSEHFEDELPRPAEKRDKMSLDLDPWYRNRDVLAATRNLAHFEQVRNALSELERAAAENPRCVVSFNISKEQDAFLSAAGEQEGQVGRSGVDLPRG